MVLHPLLLTHDRIEAFGVEVAIVHLMAARTQSRDDLLMQRGPEARDDWIRVQNKNAQRRLHPYVLTASGCPRSVELPQQAIPPTVFQNWPTASDFARFIRACASSAIGDAPE